MRRKQSIFNFNHIDPHIQEEELEEIKKLFRFYHKRFWCLKRAHGRFKKMNLLINLTSSGLIAIGTIAGAATMNPIVLGVISGLGLIVKTAMEMKNLKSKIEMAKFQNGIWRCRIFHLSNRVTFDYPLSFWRK